MSGDDSENKTNNNQLYYLPPPPETRTGPRRPFLQEREKKTLKEIIFSNPFYPLACLGIIGAIGSLVKGLSSFAKNDRNMSYKMMGSRVSFQGGAIVFMTCGFMYDKWRQDQQK